MNEHAVAAHDLLPPRSGPRPATNAPATPHTQLDQLPDDPGLADELARRVFVLPSVEHRPSIISVPGARALWLGAPHRSTATGAFLREGEFAHVHPDGSLHLTLPTEDARGAIAAGWAEWHPLVLDGRLAPTAVMVYAARDAEEIGHIQRLVHRSWRFATAPPPPAAGRST